MPKTEKGRQLDEILAHPGQRYLDLLNAHSLSRWIFSKNAAELRQITASLKDSNNAENFLNGTTREVFKTCKTKSADDFTISSLRPRHWLTTPGH